MKFTLEDIKNKLFSETYSNKQILFNCVCISSGVGGFLSSIISLTISSLRFQSVFCFACSLLCFAFLFLANWKNFFKLSAVSLISIFSFVLFPLIFFTGGGHRSGIALWFGLEIIFTFLILDGCVFWAVLCLQIVSISACFLLEFYDVIPVRPIVPRSAAFKDIVQSIFSTGFVVGAINIVQNKIYEKNLAIIEGRNKDLEKSEKKAEKANNAKTDFLSNMSHEIRTPINSILGMNEMILRESKEKKILEYAAAIQFSSNALLSLVNDVLDLSKIESGKIEIIEEQYKLSDLILNSYGMISERMEKKGIKGSVFCNKKLPSVLVGDSVHLRQILVNFLTNAVKYTEKGSIDFFVLGSVNDDEAKLVFSVKDTGMGIKAENLESVFKKFERLELQRNRTIEGSGLGLSISKQLADLMNAKIEVKSEYGKGSEFSLTVVQKIFDASPVGEVSPKRKILEKESTIYHQSFEAPEAEILAVDDVELNLIVFENLLKETKMKIDLVGSGEECLAKVKKKHYDLIFMDYMMPEMDGIQTLEKLRSEENLNKDTSVIVLTADALAGVREKYLAAGFKDYISKPIDGQNIEKILVNYLPKEKVFFKVGNQDLPCGEKISKLKNILVEFDFETALSCCDDSEQFCIEIISEYCTNNHIDELKKFFDECEWENYRLRLHALKSTSRTVGVVALAEEFKIQEAAVKKCELDFARKNHQPLMEHYEKVILKMKEAGFFQEEKKE
jgi:signal transduction histidine kinase/CheY-like chemotaxis protein